MSEAQADHRAYRTAFTKAAAISFCLFGLEYGSAHWFFESVSPGLASAFSHRFDVSVDLEQCSPAFAGEFIANVVTGLCVATNFVALGVLLGFDAIKDRRNTRNYLALAIIGCGIGAIALALSTGPDGTWSEYARRGTRVFPLLAACLQSHGGVDGQWWFNFSNRLEYFLLSGLFFCSLLVGHYNAGQSEPSDQPGRAVHLQEVFAKLGKSGLSVGDWLYVALIVAVPLAFFAFVMRRLVAILIG